ncbi:MAG: lysylphosphatidylglycerol synthase domain-containing protein, partial [Deltaproteobacteria bacterium]|nr:lysylphosphatidylglycerol synthase domain-containing protein [Candidatus Deferrimicrobiaceae bacterium]
MKFVLKIGFALGLLGLILWKLGGVREVGEQILRIDPFYLVPIVLLNVFDRGLMTFKWVLLLRARGICLPMVRAMMIYCASWVWGLFLPTTVGSDAIRAYCTSRDGVDLREVVA